MPTFDYDMSGMAGARKAIHNLAEQIENPPAKMIHRLGEASLEDVDKRFMTRGYNTWPADSEETIKKKGQAMVLIDTGAMYNSARISGWTRNSITVDVPYGGKNHDPDVPRYHQSGTKHMPQRKIIEVTRKLNLALTDVLKKWVEDMIMAFGKGV